jgi:hypothetical protein
MTDDPHEEDKRTPTETVAQPQQPVEAVHIPEILYAEARLSGEGGVTLAGDKITQLMATGAILAAAGEFPVDGNKIIRKGWRYVTDNSDIGKRPGPRSAAPFVLERAGQELKAGYSGTKRALAEKLSAEVKRHYSQTDQLTMCIDNVEGIITPLWQQFRGDAAR